MYGWNSCGPYVFNDNRLLEMPSLSTFLNCFNNDNIFFITPRSSKCTGSMGNCVTILMFAPSRAVGHVRKILVVMVWMTSIFESLIRSLNTFFDIVDHSRPSKLLTHLVAFFSTKESIMTHYFNFIFCPSIKNHLLEDWGCLFPL